MHSMVYHVPSMIKQFGSIKQFSCQGITKQLDCISELSRQLQIILYTYTYIHTHAHTQMHTHTHTHTHTRTHTQCTKPMPPGVEKNNDDARRNYFSSNRWDASTDIIQTEARLETLQKTCELEKRAYTKRNETYWNEGGIEASRKGRKHGHSTIL